MKSLLLLAGLVTSIGLNAQVTWEQDYQFSNPNINNGVEAIFAMTELPDGSYMVGGMANKPSATAYVAHIGPNGDSLWVRFYDNSYGGFDRCPKLYTQSDGSVCAVFEPLYGKITFAKLNPTNGDTVSTFTAPFGVSSNWHYFDHIELAGGDIIMSYGNGSAGSICRFTPGSSTTIWNTDYAGIGFKPSGLLLDGNSIVAAGYCTGPNWTYDMCAVKLDLNGTQQFLKKYVRNSFYADTPCGLVKDVNNNYIIGASWAQGTTVYPSLLQINSNSGDSLQLSYITNANGSPLNFGFIDKLIVANGALVGVGQVDQHATDPLGATHNVGYMAAFILDANGNVNDIYTFNDLAPYLSNNPSYSSCSNQAYSTMLTTTGDILCGGRGHYSYNTSGTYYGHTAESHLVKLNGQSLSLNSIAAEKFNIYPNPATTVVNFHSDQDGALFIHDLAGRQVLMATCGSGLNTIDVSLLPAGMYQLTYGNDTQILSSGRLIIR